MGGSSLPHPTGVGTLRSMPESDAHMEAGFPKSEPSEIGKQELPVWSWELPGHCFFQLCPERLQSLIDQGSERSGDPSKQLRSAVGPKDEDRGGEEVSKAERGRKRCTTGGVQLLRRLCSH